MYTYVHMCIHACTKIFINALKGYVFVYACVCVCIHACTKLFQNRLRGMCLYAYMFMHTCMYTF